MELAFRILEEVDGKEVLQHQFLSGAGIHVILLNVLVYVLLLEEIAVRRHHALFDGLERNAAAVEGEILLLLPRNHVLVAALRPSLLLASEFILVL